MTDTHTLRAAILRTLHVAPAGASALHRRLGRHAPRIIDATVAALAAEGLIALKWGRYRLTSAGRAALPSISSLPPMQPYVPPMVVRRPGSDHSHIPSLAGGRLIRRSA